MKPLPKPRPLVLERHDRKLQKEALAATMRAAVWARDKGCCRLCGRPVKRKHIDPAQRGEVHHLRGRRIAPGDVLDPDKCVLLDALCHSRITAKEVEVAGQTAATFRAIRSS